MRKDLNLITLKDLNREVAARTGHSVKTVGLITRATFDAIKDYLYDDIAVRVTKFGLFYNEILKAGVMHLQLQKQLTYLPKRLKPKFKFFTDFMMAVKRKKIDDTE